MNIVVKPAGGNSPATNNASGNGTTTNTTTTNVTTDTSTNTTSKDTKVKKTLGEDDVRTIFDTGKYDTYEACISDLESKGYEVDDSIEGNFGIYTDKSEEDIENAMKTLDMSRKDAIKYLGNSLEKAEESADEFWPAYNYMTQEAGMSKEDALAKLEAAGHKIPKDFEDGLKEYTDEDEQKIQGYMEAVGCTREQAIKDLGVTPKHKGVIQTGLETIGKGLAWPFVKIGEGISAGWEWLFGK